ncbi:MarR family winged helix-turn-helix transcriptional regulator [[Mycobacterium] holstebronense]|uniref:MarR family transcriptional regulator n=1 Tax=[Mycobacterium] holstebronense TaxID=3064288 RepID=A0ABM9M5H2_9MYCO|nr:MarR family transcriptional regulator [Mycolicibacter sp. MU0102]CAJ1510449.1 MarR family transcriptional regulator [Mycolicibacter sp. MU0102]
MGHLRALEWPVWELPVLDAAESTCVHQFVDTSERLLAALNDSLVHAHGLTLFEVLVLDRLASSETGSARMRDLAKAFALAPSRVTSLIDRLEAQSLVGRRPLPGDRRAVLAHITAEGRKRFAPAVVTYARGIRAYYLDQLSRQQAIALGDVCRRTGLPERY